jgi:Ulp1 family protease
MRQVDYKDKKWDIKNEFFFLPKEGMMQMADKYFFDDVYQDARSSDDRFVYKLLNGKLTDEEFTEVGITHVDENNKPILSPDAQELYYLARKLVVKSFKARKLMHEESPELHLNTFDAGWYQIKKVLQEYYKDEYKEFTDKYKAFSDRLRPQVYELGFLLK